MKKTIIFSGILALLVAGCASLLGIDPNYLQKNHILGISKDTLEREAGFDRIFLLNVRIIDYTKTFGRDTIVNFHFDKVEAIDAPSSYNTECPDGEWSFQENAHYFQGLVMAQAKNDLLRLDLLTVGKVNYGVVKMIIKKNFSLKAEHINYAGMILAEIRNIKKATVECTISHIIPTEIIMKADLELMRKKHPKLYNEFAGTLNMSY
jgi:hypothetical protein